MGALTAAPALDRRGRFLPPLGWQPKCLEPSELELWHDVDAGIPPCHSCPLAFAAEQRALGRCNGQPSGADDEEEDDVIGDNGIAGQVTQERRIELIAPCGSCLHREVCGLKDKLERAGEADVTMARLPDELQVVLQARVDCSFYARDRGAAKGVAAAAREVKPRATRNWSPEQRAAAAERMRTRRQGAAA